MLRIHDLHLKKIHTPKTEKSDERQSARIGFNELLIHLPIVMDFEIEVNPIVNVNIEASPSQLKLNMNKFIHFLVFRDENSKVKTHQSGLLRLNVYKRQYIFITKNYDFQDGNLLFSFLLLENNPKYNGHFHEFFFR